MRLNIALCLILVVSLIFCKKQNVTTDRVKMDTLSHSESVLGNSRLLGCYDFYQSVKTSNEHFDSIAPNDAPRISTKKIDSAMENIVVAEIAKDSLVGINECIGEEIRLKCYKNGVTQFGSFYTLYARDFYFGGPFSNVMGLSEGLTKGQVVQLLGKPHKYSETVWLYFSEVPDGDEADKFDARWNLYIFFENETVHGIAFCPNFDDC